MLGNLIAAGSSLLGGLLGKSSADSARASTEALARENIAQQREFAQHGLTWKIDDAFRNASRVHPIYSLGSAGASFSPVSAAFPADTSMPNALASAGQDIGRAVNATSTSTQRGDAFSKVAQTLQLEKMGLENEVLRTEIASKTGRLRQVAMPPFPSPADNWMIPGQAESSLTKSKPLDVTPGVRSQPNLEGGAITDTGMARTNDGWAPVPSKDVKERIEDNMPQEWMHFFRNNILPSLGKNMSPPPFAAPAGKDWWFNTFRQEYQLLPHGQRPLAGHRYKGK